MYKSLIKCDLLIIGSGVVGLSIGIAYLRANPGKKVIIADKEELTGKHASGRNSGVLHAGFYYSPESLKAKFCRTGNLQLRSLAKEYGITPIEQPQTDCYDAIIIAVAHQQFKQLGASNIRAYGKKEHILYDLKYVLKAHESDMRL
jgi:L-2-hydroxyglutarate oxidase LhgO